MARRGGSVHVATIRTKGLGGRVYTSYLLRRSYREGGRVRHENLGNLSHLPAAAIEAGRRVLAGGLFLGEVRETGPLAAMDWLLPRQERIERALARRHLAPGGFVLYDLSSSYLEGRCCPLAALGYSRDGQRGQRQIKYGRICSPEG